MEGGFTFIALPLGLMFFLSGFIINVFQLLATLFVLPLSRRLFRIANMVMMEALWSELIWLVDWWAGVQACFFHSQNCQFSQCYGSFTVWIPILLEGLNCGPFYAGAGVC
jgi:hypothetical protein